MQINYNELLQILFAGLVSFILVFISIPTILNVVLKEFVRRAETARTQTCSHIGGIISSNCIYLFNFS